MANFLYYFYAGDPSSSQLLSTSYSVIGTVSDLLLPMNAVATLPAPAAGNSTDSAYQQLDDTAGCYKLLTFVLFRLRSVSDL